MDYDKVIKDDYEQVRGRDVCSRQKLQGGKMLGEVTSRVSTDIMQSREGLWMKEEGTKEQEAEEERCSMNDYEHEDLLSIQEMQGGRMLVDSTSSVSTDTKSELRVMEAGNGQEEDYDKEIKDDYEQVRGRDVCSRQKLQGEKLLGEVTSRVLTDIMQSR